MKIKTNNVKFSQADIRRNITITTKLTPELAEIMGILMGDGHLGIDLDYKQYALNICGNMNEDYEHYDYINYLFYKIFNTKLRLSNWIERNAIMARIGSKAILTFFDEIGFPIGNKNDNANIPNLIKKSSSKHKINFLRGLADTDFCLTFKRTSKNSVHKYPVIKGSFKSKDLIEDLVKLLTALNIPFSIVRDEKAFDKRFNKCDLKQVIYINGIKNLELWMAKIGFNNYAKYSRYEVWKKFGFCPAYTTLEQRKKILNGGLNPYSFY